MILGVAVQPVKPAAVNAFSASVLINPSASVFVVAAVATIVNSATAFLALSSSDSAAGLMIRVVVATSFGVTAVFVAFTVTVVFSVTVVAADIVNIPLEMLTPDTSGSTDQFIVAPVANPAGVNTTVCSCPFKVTSVLSPVIAGFPACLTTVTSYSPFALEPSTAVAVTVIFAFSTAESATVNKPSVLILTSPSFKLASNVIDHVTPLFVALLGVTFAVNCNSPPISTSLLSAVISIPVTSTSSGVVVPPPISSTLGAFAAPSVLTASGFTASIFAIVPSPTIVAGLEFVDVTVIVPTSASAATSTFAVAVSLTVTVSTFAVPSKATSAFALPVTATLSTFAPSCTVTSASPTTSTTSIVASFSTVIFAPVSAVTFSILPSATSTGAFACTFAVVKPTILAAVLAIKLLIAFLLKVLISTKGASALSLTTVTLPSKLVVPINKIVHFVVFAAATAVSSPM